MLANKLELRVLEISHKLKLSHISSCLNAVNIIDNIYQVMKPEDIFVLSAGHLGLALYVVLEKNGKGNAEELFKKAIVQPWQKLPDFFRPIYDTMKGDDPSVLRFFHTSRRANPPLRG